MPVSTLRQDAISIFRAGLAAADPYDATAKSLAALKVDLTAFDRVFLVSVGKAAVNMAAAVEKFVGKRLTEGIALTKYGHINRQLKKTLCLEAGHPIPDQAGADAAQQITDLVRQLTARDLLFATISGGASALLAAPAPGVTLADKQTATDLLLKAGADIFELNCVRKHLSSLKGGQLAALAFPATTHALLLSDVIGDRIDIIGSGPTAPDSSNLADSLAVLEKYKLWNAVPGSVLRRLSSTGPETPKSRNRIFKKVTNTVVASLGQSLAAAAERARFLGYKPILVSDHMQGEARLVGTAYAAILRVLPPGFCVLAGGETTVTVTGQGKGGRNQEMALSLCRSISGISNVMALCTGTDGTDGPTDAAGALVDGETIAKAKKRGLDPEAFLKNNDAYHFFEPLKALWKTGPTGTNVMDMTIMLKRPPERYKWGS